MRKILVLLAVTLLTGTALAACGANGSNDSGGSMPRAGASDPVVDTPSRNTATADPLWLALQGRWENTGGNTESAVVFEGDSIVEYLYIRHYADRELTQADIDNGGFYSTLSSDSHYLRGGDRTSIGAQITIDGERRWVFPDLHENLWREEVGVERELVSVERVDAPFGYPVYAWGDERVSRPSIDDVRPIDMHFVVVRERREGVFVLDLEDLDSSGNPRMEVLWSCDRGHRRGAVRLTENALASDTLMVGNIVANPHNRVEG